MTDALFLMLCIGCMAIGVALFVVARRMDE